MKNKIIKPKIAILCGGHGKRLQPITNHLPKPLIPLQNKPILEHILEYFKIKGFNQFILCIGYKGDMIKDYIFNYKNNNDGNFYFSDIGDNASMLQRLYAIKDMFEDRIFCTYGDTLTNLETEDVINYHLKKKALVTITASKIRSPFGLLEIDKNGWATSFVEKPLLNYYIGHSLIEKKAMDYIDDNILNEPDGDGLISFFLKLINLKSLNVFEHHGARITFNTEIERSKAEKDIIDFYSQREGL